VALAQFNSQEVLAFNYILATSVVSMVPVVIIFLVLQCDVVKGIAQMGLRCCTSGRGVDMRLPAGREPALIGRRSNEDQRRAVG
jgi:hypothetical protein